MARQTCRDCGDLLTEQNRTMKSVSKKGKQYYLNKCKPCIVEADILLRTIKNSILSHKRELHVHAAGGSTSFFATTITPQRSSARLFVGTATPA